MLYDERKECLDIVEGQIEREGRRRVSWIVWKE